MNKNIQYDKYLKQKNFASYLNKLVKKYRNKKIIIYGAGELFVAINENYDLSSLNIVAICDKKFQKHLENETFEGFKVCSPEEIKILSPDVVLVATLKTAKIVEYLSYDLLKQTNIKIKTLVKTTFFELWNEVWES